MRAVPPPPPVTPPPIVEATLVQTKPSRVHPAPGIARRIRERPFATILLVWCIIMSLQLIHVLYSVVTTPYAGPGTGAGSIIGGFIVMVIMGAFWSFPCIVAAVVVAVFREGSKR